MTSVQTIRDSTMTLRFLIDMVDMSDFSIAYTTESYSITRKEVALWELYDFIVKDSGTREILRDNNFRRSVIYKSQTIVDNHVFSCRMADLATEVLFLCDEIEREKYPPIVMADLIATSYADAAKKNLSKVENIAQKSSTPPQHKLSYAQVTKNRA